ncbi:hypothetical protein BO70DRAFT_62761 [Aspergillus heteromorphus CBS 117.55]|uniref:Uncharacterized protein n=1 Tax=Aspergillus heteromorphus CBS 117.55 TaxID=1448321 RepID=A0A317VVC8_9EURO|nr:uncharacterized protein BO70DRAFT_62761 [Aspergillus heteromorphus CBS 117.55]PWY78336.1 hypothetical protein BO70DRAFT_62761 [Aspergillus heteromorphus CBS 117.55]
MTADDEWLPLSELPCRPWIFLFHDRCWQHLLELFGPHGADLTDIFDALVKLPYPASIEYGLHCVFDPFEIPTLDQLQQSKRKIPSRDLEIGRKIIHKEELKRWLWPPALRD